MNEFSPFEKKQQQHVRVHTQLKICDFRSKLLCGWQQKQKHSLNITYIAHMPTLYNCFLCYTQFSVNCLFIKQQTFNIQYTHSDFDLFFDKQNLILSITL